ncbi:MAG: hypothetical protein UCH28_11120 [Adlercreutzia sp.]|nr:hypothetical protein [Adlercreutzia sp.]
MQHISVSARKMRTLFLIGLTALLLALGVAATAPANAHAATASNGAKIYTLKAGKTYKSYDITGDKKADRIKIVPIKQYDGYFTGMKITVNGKTAYTNKKIVCYLGTTEMKLIKLKNGKAYLHLFTFSGNPADENTLLAYKSGKLTTAIDCTKALGKKFGWDGTYGAVAKASGNTLTMTYSTSSYMFGPIEATYKYTYKGGKLQQASTGTFSIPAKQKSFKALKNIPVYKNTACKAKKFTIKTGQKVKFTNIYVKGNTVRVKVNVGGKTGWIKCATGYESSLLYKYYDPQINDYRYEAPFENLG